MYKLFISQPMKDKSEEEIRTEREEAVKEAKKALGTDDVEVIDSYIPDTAPKDSVEALWCLGRSLELLSKADIAYFAPGWSNARGCKLEYEAANKYGIRVITCAGEEGK